VKRPPTSTVTAAVVAGCGGFSCALPAEAEASRSAAVTIVDLLRIAILPYRRKNSPDGALDPWTCWWQTTQERPASLLAPVELFST
jgi:hypothetical protein